MRTAGCSEPTANNLGKKDYCVTSSMEIETTSFSLLKIRTWPSASVGPTRETSSSLLTQPRYALEETANRVKVLSVSTMMVS